MEAGMWFRGQKLLEIRKDAYQDSYTGTVIRSARRSWRGWARRIQENLRVRT